VVVCNFTGMKYVLLITVLLTEFVQAQTYDPEKVNKKATDTYAKAIGLLQNDARREVIPVLKQAIQYDNGFVDAYLSLGGVYGELKDYANSVANYEKAFSIDSGYSKFYLLPYSINLAGMGRFDDALRAVGHAGEHETEAGNECQAPPSDAEIDAEHDAGIPRERKVATRLARE